MPTVTFGNRSCELAQGETVLDGLLRHDIPAVHACKTGSCGSCMLRAVSGQVPEVSQIGLKDAWRARGYFLPCVCRPTEDIEIGETAGDIRVAARIASLVPLSGNVLQVRLVLDGPFEFRAGQYLTLIAGDTLARSYSIASIPSDGPLELHVRRMPNGQMSTWLFDDAHEGDAVRIQGPSGECFYVPGRPDQPLLLVGTGTGLAPLYGIVRDALACGHRGPIHLFHGALRPEGLYLVDELNALAAAHSNFTYTPTTDPIERAVAGSIPKLDGYRAFVCGDPAVVQLLKRKIFLAGAAMREIHADAFLPSAA